MVKSIRIALAALMALGPAGGAYADPQDPPRTLAQALTPQETGLLTFLNSTALPAVDPNQAATEALLADVRRRMAEKAREYLASTPPERELSPFELDYIAHHRTLFSDPQATRAVEELTGAASTQPAGAEFLRGLRAMLRRDLQAYADRPGGSGSDQLAAWASGLRPGTTLASATARFPAAPSSPPAQTPLQELPIWNQFAPVERGMLVGQYVRMDEAAKRRFETALRAADGGDAAARQAFVTEQQAALRASVGTYMQNPNPGNADATSVEGMLDPVELAYLGGRRIEPQQQARIQQAIAEANGRLPGDRAKAGLVVGRIRAMVRRDLGEYQITQGRSRDNQEELRRIRDIADIALDSSLSPEEAATRMNARFSGGNTSAPVIGEQGPGNPPGTGQPPSTTARQNFSATVPTPGANSEVEPPNPNAGSDELMTNLKKDAVGALYGAVGFGLIGFILGGPIGMIVGGMIGAAVVGGLVHLGNNPIGG